jgi:hypothetical protein
MLDSPHRLIASFFSLCSHMTRQLRTTLRLLMKAWNEVGVHSNATNELLTGGTTSAGL